MKKGFTIVELIIVVAIFMFVIGAAVSIFISVVDNQRRILAEQQLLNQISYVEEYMSKALRMAMVDKDGNCTGHAGYIYLLTRYDPDLDSKKGLFRGIKFIDQVGGPDGGSICEEFYLDNTVATGDPIHPILKEVKGIGSAAVESNLTSDNLQFDTSNPFRWGINGGDGSMSGTPGCIDQYNCGAKIPDLLEPIPPQPKVTILFNVKIPDNSKEPLRIIQTTVSQRNLNAQ